MEKLNLTIHPEVLQKFPSLTVAAITAKIDDPSALTELIESLSGQLAVVSNRLDDVEPITQLQEIAVWREAYSAMSIKPSKFHSSIEALLRRVKKGGDISTNLAVVDLYNLISVIHGTPMGAYDLDKLPGSHIDIRLANPSADGFLPLGGKSDSFPLNEDLVVYAVGNDVLCWAMNMRDSIKSCVDETSTSIVFLSEATAESTSHRPKEALEALGAKLTPLGMVTSSVQIAGHERPQITF